MFSEVGGRWITIRIVGAHRSGYPHEHVLIGTEAPVDLVSFESVVAAHVGACPIAKKSAHGGKTVSMESTPSQSGPTGGIKYVASDVPGVRSVLEADGTQKEPAGVPSEAEHRARTATILEATRTQAVRIDASSEVPRVWA